MQATKSASYWLAMSLLVWLGFATCSRGGYKSGDRQHQSMYVGLEFQSAAGGEGVEEETESMGLKI